ncbi:phage holin, LLH family [Bengtsoniella intestinalis]|uniref:phage holin, LLH family n=1 Tax=Bengtsoniella intestinalis TaxID=3073143 RepID=UPI00391FAFF3
MNYTPILEAVITLIATVITVYLIPLLQAKTSAQEQTVISQWIDVAVAAAEQLCDTGLVDDKLTYVENYLESLGFSVTREEIEASVYWLGDAIADALSQEDDIE